MRKSTKIGERFGKLEIINISSDNSNVKYFCKCDCGNQDWFWASNLLYGKVNSCKECRTIPDDITGKQINAWTVLEQREDNHWLCRCECGNEVVLSKRNLRSQKCADCLKKDKEKPRDDLTNRRFGKLVALSPVKKNGRWSWNCECDCGNTKVIAARSLLSGATRSCWKCNS